MEEKKREEWRERKDSAQKRAKRYSFIHKVSSDYQCIYSIPAKTIERIHN